jgi:hypothetical protein
MPPACSAPLSPITEDSIALATIRKKLVTKWFTIFLFLGLSAFFAWLITSNLKDIYNVYLEYIDNRDYTEKAKTGEEKEDPRSIAFDDETYDKKVEPNVRRPNNKDISSSIEDIKTIYKEYNIQLKKDNKAQDTMDERMLASEYDNY